MSILSVLLYQIPPTPTPYPPGSPLLDVPSEFSLWAGAPQAIQTWNSLGDAREVLQAIFLIGLIIVGMYVLYRYARQFAGGSAKRKNDETEEVTQE